MQHSDHFANHTAGSQRMCLIYISSGFSKFNSNLFPPKWVFSLPEGWCMEMTCCRCGRLPQRPRWLFGTGAQARVGASASASPRRALARSGNPPLGDSEMVLGARMTSLAILCSSWDACVGAVSFSTNTDCGGFSFKTEPEPHLRKRWIPTVSLVESLFPPLWSSGYSEARAGCGEDQMGVLVFGAWDWEPVGGDNSCSGPQRPSPEQHIDFLWFQFSVRGYESELTPGDGEGREACVLQPTGLQRVGHY